ncbi:hypothetical protein [Paenarthrobacter ilicis]|uniref:GIY-YIG domain-containing protein n=1 Tax=Paenarthrobacter ilicis TaxID=43665 RepID=A0ABX0TNQ5_9MICC|nr:hypothetical protein [Paenarthrobacter ilicis]MBM7793052.1 hypothetical protein [Paenarthrobacter ilicis]NIJ03470.1 hypothetical protein [Paenarthrobacter ilicis]
MSTVLSGGSSVMCQHEVLYVGRAEDVNRRLDSHKTIQRIYEQHAHSKWDIFVTPLVIEETLTLFGDHIDDADTQGDPGLLFTEFGQRAEGRASATAIAVAEHAMISYFKPDYNTKLKEWDGRLPTKHFDVMRRGGARLAVVHVQGAYELARFFSQNVQEERTHVIWAEVPTDTRVTGYGAIPSTQAPQAKGLGGYDLMLNSSTSLKGLYDTSDIVLTTFGAYPPDLMPSGSAWTL